jgi:hypothetical protein
MLLLTPHDSSVLTSLVQYERPSQKRSKLFGSLEEPSARIVAEAYFDTEKYAEAPDDVRATVDHFRAWVENNRRRRSERETRRRVARG